MEYSSQDRVNVYITTDDVDSENVAIEISSDEEREKPSEPTVFVTQLPKSLATAQEFRMQASSKDLGKNQRMPLLSQIESDGKGNSIVTIQVPVDSNVTQEDKQIINVHIADDGTINESNIKKATIDVVPLKEGRILISNGRKYLIKPATNRIPIWKRETPKPPGYMSNYLYPHELKGARRRLIIDCPTNIPVPEFKSQLADTSDIVTTLDLAPSTKRKIKELTTNSVSKLFAYPGKPYPSKRLYGLFHRHLTIKPQTHENPDDLDLLPIGYSPTIDYTQVKRITRKRKQNETVEATAQTPVTSEAAATAGTLKSTSNIVKSMVPISDQVVRVVLKSGVMGEEEQEILVLHDGTDKNLAGLEGSSALQQSIQGLLAAAERGELEKGTENMEQVFICNEGTYDNEDEDSFMTEQIIIVQDNIDEGEEPHIVAT